MEISHKVSLVKLMENYKLEGYSLEKQEKIKKIAQKISLSSLARVWQMFLKGNLELSSSNLQKITFEMLLIRICHLAAMPNLQQISLEAKENQNYVATKENSSDDNVVNEILRSFEGAKLVN